LKKLEKGIALRKRVAGRNDSEYPRFEKRPRSKEKKELLVEETREEKDRTKGKKIQT